MASRCRTPESLSTLEDLLRKHSTLRGSQRLNLNFRHSHQHTPLSAALMSANMAAFELFLQYGADINRQYPGVPNLLVTAARHADPRLVSQLIDHGIDLGLDGVVKEAISVAGSVEVIECLLERIDLEISPTDVTCCLVSLVHYHEKNHIFAYLIERFPEFHVAKVVNALLKHHPFNPEIWDTLADRIPDGLALNNCLRPSALPSADEECGDCLANVAATQDIFERISKRLTYSIAFKWWVLKGAVEDGAILPEHVPVIATHWVNSMIDDNQ